MKIEFVNHSSFIIENRNTRIICDPWLEGSVFNNGWNLIAPTKLSYDDFKNIQYIWFSHEHPDHFFPPNIKKIPAEHRANITVLFQHTIDKRVVDWCKKTGFKETIELYPDKWLELTDGIKVLCEHFDEGDSWICFQADKQCILNTNDCGIRGKGKGIKIKNKVGKVDILLTQFSYAYWAGNPEEIEFRKKVADEKLEGLKFQAELFEPSVIIPIASFVYFSHVENEYLNDAINTPAKTFSYIEKNTRSTPVILYNGERYALNEKHDSSGSISLYEKDFALIKKANLYHKTNVIPENELVKTAEIFLKELNEKNSFYLKRSLKPCHIYLKDHHKSFTLSLAGFTLSDIPESDCDVSISSENLSFCFQYEYGLDTTQINGRFRKPARGSYSRFYNFFRINQLKSRGINPNSISYLLGAIKRKILQKIGLYKA